MGSSHSQNDAKEPTGSADEKATATVRDLPTVDGGGNKAVNVSSLDEGAELMLEFQDQLDDVTEDEFNRIRRRIDWHLLPLMMALYWIQFGDKTSLGNAAILGIKADNNLDQNRFNQCSSFFYISYLVCEYPLSLCLQRFRTGRVLTICVLSWAVLLLAHMACSSYPGLLVLRLLLGATEGVVTPAFLLVTSAYYRMDEQATRVGLWFCCNGVAIITNSLIAYGVQDVTLGNWKPWRVFFLILGVITFALFVLYFFLFPDTPATAWFLSRRERAIAIKRIAGNQSGTKNPHFKRDQFIEALTDPKTYLFCFYSIFANIPNSLTQQRSIIINQLGFDTLQTALLNIPTGVLEIISIPLATWAARRYTGHTTEVMTLWTLPSLVGAAMLIGLSQEHKIARLVGVYLAPLNTAAFVLALSWCSASSAGTTKKSVVNASNLIAYCVGNLVGPYIWQSKYSPQNIVPWSVCMVSYFLCIPISYALRSIMLRENKRRVALVESGDDKDDQQVKHEVQIDVVRGPAGSNGSSDAEESVDGTAVSPQKLDTAFLDLTDRQNLNFRYPL